MPKLSELTGQSPVKKTFKLSELQSGNGDTTEFKNMDWYDRANSAITKLGIIPEEFVNNASFGALDMVNAGLNKIGIPSQRAKFGPDNPIGKTAETIAGFAGALKGPGKVSEMVGAKILPGVSGKLANLARTAGEGATFGALMPGDLKQRFGAAAMGSITNPLVMGAQGLMKPTANRMMLSIMKPSRDVIKKSPNLGIDALELGITGSKEQMANKADALIKKYEDQVSNIIKGSNKRIDANKIITALDEAKENAIRGLKQEDASAIEQVKQNFIDQLPKKTVTTESGFVIPKGSESISKEPTVKKFKLKTSERYPQRLGDSKALQSGDIPSAATIENPADVKYMPISGKRVVIVSPKVDKTIKSEDLFGPKNIESESFPDYLGMNLERGQDMKKAIYSETPDAAFNRSMQENPGATEARRKVASTIRKEMIQAEPSLDPVLKKESTSIKVKKALENQIANEQKHVLISKLGGMGSGAMAMSGNIPGAVGVLAGDSAVHFLRSAPSISNTAKAIYKLSNIKDAGKKVIFGGRKLFGDN